MKSCQPIYGAQMTLHGNNVYFIKEVITLFPCIRIQITQVKSLVNTWQVKPNDK